jgi:hypothetical protein
MNREDIIRIAHESHLDVYGLGTDYAKFADALERFAALVASAEREKHKWDIHSCSPTCNRYACVATREAVLAEREACAKVCEEYADDSRTGATCAEVIRARKES